MRRVFDGHPLKKNGIKAKLSHLGPP